MELTQDVLHSPAVAVLCDLEHAGLDLAVVDGRLRVWPVERLTADYEQLIQQHRDELVTLVNICDDGVQERVARFKQLIVDAPADVLLPALVFQAGVPYVKALCFSCGDPLGEPRYGRCWRCSLAWRLAMQVPITGGRLRLDTGGDMSTHGLGPTTLTQGDASTRRCRGGAGGRSMDDFTLEAPSPPADPFLKWVGGKRQLLPELRPWYPTSFTRYVEPFLGGGAVFFDLATHGHLGDCQTTLSDISGDLIGCCLMVRDHVEELIQALTALAVDHNEDGHYNRVRVDFNAQRRPLLSGSGLVSDGYTPTLAARFIYLNRTCFNGLFRLNTKGGFNTPIGRYKNPTICDAEGLRRVSACLGRLAVRIVEADFDRVLDEVQVGDFVYCDPPYAPLNGTANFTTYTSGGFSAADQRRLQRRVVSLARDGCRVVVSNSAAPLITQLYRDNAEARDAGLRVYEVAAKRSISANAAGRGPIAEYIITNLPLRGRR